ncbi:puromycin n-acetyltransferase [Fusarium albosuccineum]|uniref:Puromycin n-acetyltransferase n=1 Tax=Fusarium albosuccineum TaxID=1237068 RepID=A0A8H4PHI4_9HYPO|nr:puromycin n-acetyltransferase [Fusarium albosuccineum]
MPPTYRIRPGLFSDVNAASMLYLQSFAKEPLLDYMFPNRHVDPTTFNTWLIRRFWMRYWTPGYVLTMLDACGEDGKVEPVGFTWWHRPVESFSFRERWLSPRMFSVPAPIIPIPLTRPRQDAWIAPLMRSFLKLQSYFFPIPSVDPQRITIYDRVFSTLEASILNSPRRRSAWYLSSLGVSPDAQGNGIGSLLLQDGLREADRAGVLTWLVGLRGLDAFYSRFGYVEVARANVGELKDWDGGIVMFRGE